MKKYLSVGEMAIPRVPTNLFSSIFVRSPDGSAFSPEVGPHIWGLTEMGVVIDIFEMPFAQKKMYRVLLTGGGTGWVWDDRVVAITEELKV